MNPVKKHNRQVRQGAGINSAPSPFNASASGTAEATPRHQSNRKTGLGLFLERKRMRKLEAVGWFAGRVGSKKVRSQLEWEESGRNVGDLVKRGLLVEVEG